MIYLDNNATTCIDKRVYIKQCEVLNKYYGNPSSLYPFGGLANNMIQSARKKVASMINADAYSYRFIKSIGFISTGKSWTV